MQLLVRRSDDERLQAVESAVLPYTQLSSNMQQLRSEQDTLHAGLTVATALFQHSTEMQIVIRPCCPGLSQMACGDRELDEVA